MTQAPPMLLCCPAPRCQIRPPSPTRAPHDDQRKRRKSSLVVTNGLPSKPSGPLYPQLLDVLVDQPVIERPGFFNCFSDEAFAEAVRQTGRRKLVIGGVSTEGCVLQTVLGALREGPKRMSSSTPAPA
ncbi:isochorismatase family protein [Streptomyces mirabilis]|uniref:isochorismatase family protein n=1 Tax=Streptomyces mirabilis TaxID=68239 RepID=UPI00296EA32F